MKKIRHRNPRPGNETLVVETDLGQITITVGLLNRDGQRTEHVVATPNPSGDAAITLEQAGKPKGWGVRLTEHVAAKADETCGCGDKACPAHMGEASCVERRVIMLRRIHTDDLTGTGFCHQCGDEALDSGLFAVVR